MDIFLLLPTSFAVALWRAFVLCKLWMWFIVPVFTTMPRLSTLQLYGVWSVFEMLRFKPVGKLREDYNAWASISEHATFALIALGIGALVHKMLVNP